MPSGYEKSPDYGSPPPSPTYIRLGAIAILALTAVIVWQMFPHAPRDCVAVPTDAIITIDQDGRQRSILRLDKVKIPEGGCLRIAP